MKIETQLGFYKSFEYLAPVININGVVVTDESWHQEPLYASYSRLYFVTEGSGILFSEEEKIVLEPGYVYLAPCGIKCGFKGTPSVKKLFFHINLSLGEDGSDVFERFGRFARIPRSVEYMEKLTRWYLGNDPKGHLLVKNEIYRTICDFLRMNEDENLLGDGYSVAVTDSIRYIRANLRANLTTKDVIKAALCSQSKLAVLFKNELGRSVSDYIEDLLMSEAQTMLLYSEMSVGQISEKLGYCDQFYFSRRFKKRFGQSPREYRQKNNA